MRTMHVHKNGQLGFTIIEALIALVIMGFGILALSGLQAALSRSTDNAKQRTEAVRLAQEKIESLRSYTGITATVIGQGTISNTALNWSALSNGNDSISADSAYKTNTTYTRAWTLSGTATDPVRWLTVDVNWIDRTGASQKVSLSSSISKSNPADSGFLGFPLSLSTNLKLPMNRNLDIPIPAIDIGNGKSALKFGSNGNYIVFDNISGDITKVCTPSLTTSPNASAIISALNSIDSISNCKNITGFFISGYIEIDKSATQKKNDELNNLSINHSSITRNMAGSTPIECQFGNATNQNSGETIANLNFYLCVVPLAAPSPALTTNGPYNWSGTVRIAGLPSGNSKYYVCRYQYTATNSLTDPNQRNIQPYVEVNKSIDQQNYLIVAEEQGSCPSSMTVANVATGVLHQDCRSASNPNYATACP